MYKISKQREWIYTYMLEHPGQHFSAEDIFAGLNEMGKTVSILGRSDRLQRGKCPAGRG